MSIATRRRWTRIYLAIDMCCLVALVIGTAVKSHPDWALAFGSVAACLLSLCCGLAYLRSTGSTPHRRRTP